jgi:hypothetical protein
MRTKKHVVHHYSDDEEANQEALQQAHSEQMKLAAKIQSGGNQHGAAYPVDVMASYEASLPYAETDEQKAHLMSVLTSGNHKRDGKI